MRSFCVLLALLGLAPAMAQARPAPPTLIVAVSVDQFSADLFAEYRPRYEAGLARLSREGVVFPSGFQGHAITETCPGHSTILTGSRPSRTGVVANDWYDPALGRRVNCMEDPNGKPEEGRRYATSPANLRVPTLGDRLKAVTPASRVVAVAGKDRSALMLGGHRIDQFWYWDRDRFRGSGQGPTPRSVREAAARGAAMAALPFDAAAPAVCRDRAAPIDLDGRTYGLVGPRPAGDTLQAARTMDTAVADAAIGLLDEMQLGRGPAVDVLAIGLSATDTIGHSYGTAGAEMCAQQMAVDAHIGRILAALDRSGVAYALVLTADHGGYDMPERNRQRGALAERAEPSLTAIAPAVAAELGLADGPPLFTRDGESFHVTRPLAPDARRAALELLKRRLLEHPQVAAAFTAEELRQAPPPALPVPYWSLIDRARESFDIERSGDLMVLLKPYVMRAVTRPTVATHGSPWDYDRRVPIVFYWPGAAPFEQPIGVETADILPTLAPLVGLDVPASEIDGRCLDILIGPEDSCRPGS